MIGQVPRLEGNGCYAAPASSARTRCTVPVPTPTVRATNGSAEEQTVNSPLEARAPYPNRFRAGQSGNPRGRPRGSPNTLPSVRDLVLDFVQGREDAIEAALTRALASPRHTIALLELLARLNRETGSDADQGAGAIQILINTTVPLDQLGPQPKELPDGARGPEEVG
jgi:hypothetical protein